MCMILYAASFEWIVSDVSSQKTWFTGPTRGPLWVTSIVDSFNLAAGVGLPVPSIRWIINQNGAISASNDQNAQIYGTPLVNVPKLKCELDFVRTKFNKGLIFLMILKSITGFI